MLGREHPFYTVLPKSIVRKDLPYSWYIRIPNLIAFLRHIRPALEKTSHRHCCGRLHGGTQDEFLSQRHPLHI